MATSAPRRQLRQNSGSHNFCHEYRSLGMLALHFGFKCANTSLAGTRLPTHGQSGGHSVPSYRGPHQVKAHTMEVQSHPRKWCATTCVQEMRSAPFDVENRYVLSASQTSKDHVFVSMQGNEQIQFRHNANSLASMPTKATQWTSRPRLTPHLE